jgi:hypothetical protein
MRILPVIVISALVGTTLGSALAYLDIRWNDSEVTLPTTGPAATPVIAADAPRVQVDETTFNFGTMQRGTKKSHEFVFKNVGNAPLTLRVGSTSCKCALGTVGDAPIPPGESVKVQLEWKAESGGGAYRQTATVETNDPVQSQVLLVVDGTVTEASGVSPQEFVFDKVTAGGSKSAAVYVMAMNENEIVVSDPQLSDPKTRDFFDIKIEPAEHDSLPNAAAKDGVRVEILAKPGLPIGRFNQWLVLRTNLEDAEELNIPLVGRVVGDISVHGNGWNEAQGVLALGKVKSGDGKIAKLNMVVHGEGASDVRFEVASCDPPELKVTIGESNKLKESLANVPVTVEVPPGTRPMVRLETAQGKEGRIVLHTTRPASPELVLGVRFTVER